MPNVERNDLWAVVLQLRPIKDGNSWSLLWGDPTTSNIQECVCAFGDTPMQCVYNFEQEMQKSLKGVK